MRPILRRHERVPWRPPCQRLWPNGNSNYTRRLGRRCFHTLESDYAPIGGPVGARRLYVLDAELNLVPQGAVGELYVGGLGLARGYLNNPALTADRFVADPFSSAGGRLYRTGDLVRWRSDGHLEYMGRLDHQIKIRGFRVELGEIEAQLLAQTGVREAVVLAHETRNGRLSWLTWRRTQGYCLNPLC